MGFTDCRSASTHLDVSTMHECVYMKRFDSQFLSVSCAHTFSIDWIELNPTAGP